MPPEVPGKWEWLHPLLSLHQTGGAPKSLKHCRSERLLWKCGCVFVGNSRCLWKSCNGRSKTVGFAVVSACLQELEKSATKRLIQQVFDKLQPDTLKCRQICSNTHVFYGKVSRQMETEHCTLALSGTFWFNQNKAIVNAGHISLQMSMWHFFKLRF